MKPMTRDHCDEGLTSNERDHCCSNIVLHFYTFVPVMKDHLSHKTTFCGPMGWSLITGLTVHYWLLVILCLLAHLSLFCSIFISKIQLIIYYKWFILPHHDEMGSIPLSLQMVLRSTGTISSKVCMISFNLCIFTNKQ